MGTNLRKRAFRTLRTCVVVRLIRNMTGAFVTVYPRKFSINVFSHRRRKFTICVVPRKWIGNVMFSDAIRFLEV